MTDARLARESVEVLIETVGSARLSRLSAEVLIDHAPPVLVDQASESDTARAVTWAPKIRIIGQATETDTAQQITEPQIFGQVGQASETGTAQPVTPVKVRQIGQAAEADTAQVILPPGDSVLVEQATETDAAQALTRVKLRTVGQATETDTAQAVSVRKRRIIGQATETDQAFSRVNFTTWIDDQYDYARDRDGLDAVLTINPPTVPPPDDLAALASPSAPTLTAISGAGLAAGTYSYRVAAYRHDVSQITLPSPAANITISTPNLRVQVEWPPVTNASGYVVFAAPGASPADDDYQEVGRT